MRVPLSISIVLSCLLVLGSACDEDAVAPNASTASDAGVEPVAKERLTSLVPREVDVWKLQSVVGDVHALGRGTISSATAIYTRGSGDTARKVSLAIVDGAHRAAAYANFETAWGTKLENASVAYSHVAIGADRAVQIVTRHPVTVQLHVLLANRVVLQADAEKLAPEELLAFVNALPLDAFRALK